MLAACPSTSPSGPLVMRTFTKEDYQCLSDFFGCIDRQEKAGVYPAICPTPKCVTQYVSDCEANQP